MKMQKAEIEFVVFDAQDVITTSGPSALFGYFEATLEDGDGGTFADFGSSTKRRTFYFPGDEFSTYINFTKDAGARDADYYIINSATYEFDEVMEYRVTLTCTDDKPTGSDYKKLASPLAVLEWLQKVATQR